ANCIPSGDAREAFRFLRRTPRTYGWLFTVAGYVGQELGYRITYSDGDSEDIGNEELMQLMGWKGVSGESKIANGGKLGTKASKRSVASDGVPDPQSRKKAKVR
ncbi:hypothetical protein CYMTET_54636, partial [Cymbomonas tetramitiformis]